MPLKKIVFDPSGCCAVQAVDAVQDGDDGGVQCVWPGDHGGLDHHLRCQGWALSYRPSPEPYDFVHKECMHAHDLDSTLYFTELTIQGGHCSPYTYPKAISMIEKKQLPMEVSI